MDDVRRVAEERASRPKTAPVGASFESERQRSKNALIKQLESQNGSNVRLIAATPEIPEEDRILRVAAYCRVSTDDIDQAISIRLQIQQYTKKIKDNPNWRYAGTYVDDGFSGTNTEHRQGFQKLMRDAMDGKIDMMFTKAVSRFARNLTDCMSWVEKLQNHDPPVRVYFEQENLDTMSQTSGIILFVLAMVAQEESHMKSEAVLLSIEWRFSRGRFLLPSLFGYDAVLVPDGFGGTKKVLIINEQEARVVRWMYASLLNGCTPEEIAAFLTDLAIPTKGRRKDGTLNTHWTAQGVITLLRNEKYCGDVLARKTYTPDYKTHKARKNKGKKNKYYHADHHEAIVDRATWNAAQRILNSRRYRHAGAYLPMRIIDHGTLTGYISMNRNWAGFDYDDYYRASQITMGLLDETLEVDLSSEHLPEAGRRSPGLIDDHGIAQIARELSEAEHAIKDELEGKSQETAEESDSEDITNVFQVIRGSMFSHVSEPVFRLTPKGISFSKTCVARLGDVQFVEFLFNPVERMAVVRPCAADHPNAIPWDNKQRGAAPMCRILYTALDFDADYSFRFPCQVVRSSNGAYTLFFDLDNFIGQTPSKKDEVIIPQNSETGTEETPEEAKSYYYPPDAEEPQEIKEMEDRFQKAVEENEKVFGTPAFEHASVRSLPNNADLMVEARPLDTDHAFPADVVDQLACGIRSDPPVLPVANVEASIISVENTEV